MRHDKKNKRLVPLDINLKISAFAYGMLIFFVCALTIDIYAIDNHVKKLLRQATGITDGDVKAASSKNKITLFDAYALAVQKTERLAIEGENSVQAEERKLQAIETFLPILSLNGSYAAYPKPSSTYLLQNRSTAGFTARLPIITGLDQISQIKSSWSDRRVKEYQLYNNAGLLLSDVGTAFYNVLLIERDLATNEGLLDLYYQTVTELQRRVRLGRSRQSDILRTNAQIYTLQAQIKSLRTNHEHAKLVLATLIGATSDFSLADTIVLHEPAFSISDTAKLVDGRWDVLAAREQVTYDEAGVWAAYGKHVPSFYVEGSYYLYQQTVNTPHWLQALEASASPLSLSSGSSSFKYPPFNITLGATLPIFGGDITFAKVREANSKKRQSDLTLSQTIRQARQNIIDSFQTWESSKIELDAYRKALSSSEDNYKVVMREYGLNLVTILDVLTSLTSLQTSRDDFERAELQVKLNRVSLGVAINEFSGDNIRKLQVSTDPASR
jgi:outer membrane protein